MAKLLWKPSEERIKGTNMYRFMNFINDKYNEHFTEYNPFYQWSIDHIPEFWASLWEFADIKASKPYDQVIELNIIGNVRTGFDLFEMDDDLLL